MAQTVFPDDDMPRFEARVAPGLKRAFALPVSGDEMFRPVLEALARLPARPAPSADGGSESHG